MSIKKDWNIFIENKKFPYIIVDNWYNSDEEKSVWKELDFYSSVPTEKIDRAENTIIAKNKDGIPLGRSFRWYLSSFYTNEGIKNSSIVNAMYKIRSEKFHKIIGEIVPWGRTFLNSNQDNTMISYYEENDHYNAHIDNFSWSQCIWFFKEPKLFKGGDFYFADTNTKIELKHNRSLFFPSCLLHKVTPLNFNKKPAEIGYGRYTITHFYYYWPIS